MASSSRTRISGILPPIIRSSWAFVFGAQAFFLSVDQLMPVLDDNSIGEVFFPPGGDHNNGKTERAS